MHDAWQSFRWKVYSLVISVLSVLGVLGNILPCKKHVPGQICLMNMARKQISAWLAVLQLQYLNI